LNGIAVADQVDERPAQQIPSEKPLSRKVVDVARFPRPVTGVFEEDVIIATTLITGCIINDPAGCKGSSARTVPAGPEFDFDDEH